MDRGGARVPEVAPSALIDSPPQRALALVEVPEQLEGEVLEGEGRAVEELEHVGRSSERAQRGDPAAGKTA